MNALIAVILGAITVYLTYTRYARGIEEHLGEVRRFGSCSGSAF